MANSVHRKTYRLGDLISPRGDLERRCRRIETFTSTSGPEVRFEFTDDVLIRTSPHLTGAGPLRETLPGHRQQLASLIDAAHANKLVHGDIGLKNLVLSQGTVHLIDWEPCLRQLIGDDIRLVVSPPCHHPADRRSRSVSILTDLMGLALLWPGQTALSASRLATAALKENRESPATALARALDQQGEQRRGSSENDFGVPGSLAGGV